MTGKLTLQRHRETGGGKALTQPGGSAHHPRGHRGRLRLVRARQRVSILQPNRAISF